MPRGTLPKLALDGVARSAGATPVPVIAKLTELFEASLVSARYPANDPGDAGANFSVTVTDVAGRIVVGTLSPLTLNALPETVSFVMVSAARPSFQMVIRNCLFDFAAAIGVGNQVCAASAMHEDASLQNVRIWIFYCGDFFPLGRLLKIRPDSNRRTPIQIFRRIIAVSYCCWHRHNRLVCIVVSKRDKHVN
jgi:hypothetical protein